MPTRISTISTKPDSSRPKWRPAFRRASQSGWRVCAHAGSMVPGAPEQARWMRAEPRRSLPAPVLERIAHTASPGCRVLASEPLGDGLRNANFKLKLDPAPEPVVLRIYEHDASLCQKEVDLMRLVGGTGAAPGGGHRRAP